MNSYGAKFWNDRYSVKEYVYGTEPNNFLKEQLDKIPPGNILLLGEGEGRNAVYAAKKGWQVYALDYSEAARNKALELAKIEGVKISYDIQDLRHFKPLKKEYDAVSLIFFHIESKKRQQLHKNVNQCLSPGGTLIMEVYEKEQLGKSSGGPQDFDMLYSLDEIKNDFSELKTIILKKEIIMLNEGDKHRGDASVCRYVGQKVK